MKETYEELLARAPKDHFSEEFRLFLINNNKVRFIDGRWLVIENCKYWTPENDWLTAFYLNGGLMGNLSSGLGNLDILEKYFPGFKDRELLLKSEKNRSVKLFHVHLYKK
jgi:hypothetical protein